MNTNPTVSLQNLKFFSQKWHIRIETAFVPKRGGNKIEQQKKRKGTEFAHKEKCILNKQQKYNASCSYV